MNVQLVESIKQVIQALPLEEQAWLRNQLSHTSEPNLEPKITDLNQFSGVIQLNEDPLSFQRQIRDEWQ